MTDQKQYSSLKRMPGVYESIIELLEYNEQELFNKVVALPNDNPLIGFVKFSMIDFILNCKSPGSYNNNDEQSVYCEVFIPIFKSFGNCTRSPTYA